MEELLQLIDRLASEFLYLTRDLDIAPVLDATGIGKRFPEGALPNELLLRLLADETNPGDAHLALEIIESLNRP